MAKSKKNSIDRRGFLKRAALGAAALVTVPAAISAPTETAPAQRTGVPPMSAEAEVGVPSPVEVLTEGRSGSDFMTDVIKSLGIEYFAFNPGSSFRGLHESILNYGGNKNPEILTCCHEESSVAMAHGYAKIEGKPMGVLVHGTVGLQHASMGIYNAFCDHVPVFLIAGNIQDATKRLPPVEWAHSVQDVAAMVRDFTKWDDFPSTLNGFAESAARAYKIAMTPPTMPVLLVADGELQENPIPDNVHPRVSKLTLASPPQGDEAAVNEVARMLVAAENPLFVVGRAVRSPEGMARLVELAEALQAPVVDQSGRLNFPTRHPLYQLFQNERSRQLIANADVIVGLDPVDFWGAVNVMRDQVDRTARSITKPGTKLVTITANDLFTKSNYQNFQRYPDLDLSLAADPEETLPSLIEAVKRFSNADRQRVFEARGAKLAAGAREGLQRARDAAAFGWDASPVSTARLCTELWAQIKNEDWSLVSPVTFVNYWPLRLWDGTKPYHFLGDSGGYGIGYGAPAAIGAALANRKYGRLSVNIQCDGDFMYAPGVWWTAAHHKIPLLSVMHNNRSYHQERMQVQIMADRHSRGVTQADIGTAIADPDINYAKVAQGMGVYAEGPISDPKDLGPAIQRALAVVKRGEPALVDVHTQPR